MWKPTLVDPRVLFHGWLIYSYLQIFKLINCKWLPGECADWFFDNIMTWPHWRYSMYRQKNSVLIHEHALNSEPVPLKVDCLYALLVTWSMLLVMFENNKSAGLWKIKQCRIQTLRWGGGGEGGQSSRPLDKGVWSLKKINFRPFGPQSGP